MSASDSDNNAVISAVILSTVTTFQQLQQCASENGRRTRDHGKRSNAQMVTSLDN